MKLVLGSYARGDDDFESSNQKDNDEDDGRTLWRKIREMIDRVSETRELMDPAESKAKMLELLTNLSQFFDKITIKAEKKNDDEEDDAGYQREKEIVWEDDNYIKPIRDVKTMDWDDTVFTAFGPLIGSNWYTRRRYREKCRHDRRFKQGLKRCSQKGAWSREKRKCGQGFEKEPRSG
ncbi:hypothetical protein E2562_011903 [Oryza meyeriana var. granulata]|uniref:Uncharacterized protein n=1 Tax=Oryza meyeriana var. granulata TaxID=110450 RepID=A0A6G1CEC4_9ORYZ|nr:hypothetical protein E2562_011903 [Oryza meyeriana var. granulata]